MMNVHASKAANRLIYRKMAMGKDMTQRGIRRGFFALGKDLKAEVKKEILRKPKGGRTYIIRTKQGRKRRHVASAPGETHANLSGDLRRSVGWKVHGHDRMDFGYGAIPGRKEAPKYAKFVEFGTKNMDERPSLKNAIDKTQRNAERHFINGITGEFTRR